MNKNLIRLTESDLHRIVKESVNRILMESETTAADMFWSDGDLVSINTHKATYYPEDEDGGETIEFDYYDKDNGIPFEIEPCFDMEGFDEWDNNMIADIDWGVSYYAPKDMKDLYNQYKPAIDNIMNANKDYFLERVRDSFQTP